MQQTNENCLHAVGFLGILLLSAVLFKVTASMSKIYENCLQNYKNCLEALLQPLY